MLVDDTELHELHKKVCERMVAYVLQQLIKSAALRVEKQILEDLFPLLQQNLKKDVLEVAARYWQEVGLALRLSRAVNLLLRCWIIP